MAADGVQRATVTLDSYSYTPNHLIVEAGKPVELTLTSVTTIVPHNFIIKGPGGKPIRRTGCECRRRRSPLNLRRLSLAHFPSTATNVSGRCPAIATKGWKGSWKCDRCGYEHRDLSSRNCSAISSSKCPVSSTQRWSWFRQMCGDQVSLAYLFARAADTIADTELIDRPRRLDLLSQLKAQFVSDQIAWAQVREIQQARGTNPAEFLPSVSCLNDWKIALRLFQTFAPDDRRRVQRLMTTLTQGMRDGPRRLSRHVSVDLTASEDARRSGPLHLLRGRLRRRNSGRI